MRDRNKTRKSANAYYHRVTKFKPKKAIELTPKLLKQRLTNQLQRKYKITYEQYLDLVFKSNGHCAICNMQFDGRCKFKSPHVDHNHQTGEVRGLLCQNCNFDLSRVENTDWLDKAKAYIVNYEKLSKEHSLK